MIIKEQKRVPLFGVIYLCLIFLFTQLPASIEAKTVSANSSDYANTIFDTSKVHDMNIEISDYNLNKLYKTALSEEYVPCDITIDGEKFKNVGIRAMGNTSLSLVNMSSNKKHSFKIKFNYYVKEQLFHGLDQLCLNNFINDTTYMKEYLSYKMMSDFGVTAPLTSYTFCTLNNKDFGLYLTTEAISTSFVRRNYPNNIIGNIYKPNNISRYESRDKSGISRDITISEFLSTYCITKDDIIDSLEEMIETNTTEPLEKHLKSSFDKMSRNNNLAFSPSSAENPNVTLQYIDDNVNSYEGIWLCGDRIPTQAEKQQFVSIIKQLNKGENLEEVIDIEQLIRYFVVHNYTANLDSYTGVRVHNYYLYVADKKLHLIPWDYNLAFGTVDSGDATPYVNDFIDSPLYCKNLKSRPLFGQIILNEQYKAIYHKYFNDFINTIGSDEYISHIINTTKELISDYIKRDINAFYSYKEFENGTNSLETFCKLRSQSIQQQLMLIAKSPNILDELNNFTPVNASFIQLESMGNMRDMLKIFDASTLHLNSYIGEGDVSKIIQESEIVKVVKEIDFDHTTLSELTSFININRIRKKVSFIDMCKLQIVQDIVAPYSMLLICIILLPIVIFKVSYYKRRR